MGFTNNNDILTKRIDVYEDKIHKQNYTTGLFLLVLSVSGNFIAETLSCRTRSLLTHSMIAKNILILFSL